MALAFLTPAFVFIPSATLGAVIIMAASQMFDWKGIGTTSLVRGQIRVTGVDDLK